MKKAFKETFLHTIDSTQLYAKRLYQESPTNQWSIVLAEFQTHGLGQYNRKWYSPKDNLSTTFSFPYPTTHLESLPCITQVAAVSVCQALGKLNLKGEIKWKNDVLIKRRKICGILAEAESFGDTTMVFTGIGVNVNMGKDELKEVDQPITSIKEELGHEVDKKLVYESIRDIFMDNIDVLINKGFTQFLSYINENSMAFGKIVKVTDDGYVSKGEFLGLDQRGFLVLKTDDGNLIVLANGQMVLEDGQKY